ncbi:MAG: MerR family transcriptional regulator [Clostridiales bacterium]|jgi:flagellar operon protein (TIGR03826 family)|nr:MerR family transcriptional regulator [Clostridiales bacterium]
MDFRNCIRCGRLFAYTTKPICEDCVLQEEKDFIRIKEHLNEHPGISIVELSKETEVPVNRITKYLKEGRLEIISDEGELLSCEKCGRPITSGRFCEDCLVKLNSAISDLYTPPEIKEDNYGKKSKQMFTYKGRGR